MYLRKLILFLILLAAACSAYPRGKVMETVITDPMFRTLTVTKNGNLMADPVLTMGTADRLVFSFDEISDDRRYLRCRLLHCNADWEPSSLVESEYVDSFNFDQIEDFGFSQNAYIHYVNYRYELGPESQLAPLVSGNYVWQVYDEDDPDKVLLQARFRVSEDIYRVSGRADGRTDRGFNTEWQQLKVALDRMTDEDMNPYTDIMLEIVQNGRPDTSRFILHPQRLESGRSIYEYFNELIFPAGNEYRRFETVRTDYPGMRIETTGFEEPMYHAWIMTDEERAGRSYTYDSTQRGRYKLDEYNATDPDLGADYVMTHFTLDYPRIMDGDIFVEGDLALRGYTDVNKMKFDPETNLYTLEMPLKQGSYNYQYVVRRKAELDEGNNIGGNISGVAADNSLIEGNHYETINEYNLYVYLRRPGSRADRLLGAATIVATP